MVVFSDCDDDFVAFFKLRLALYFWSLPKITGFMFCDFVKTEVLQPGMKSALIREMNLQDSAAQHGVPRP